MLRVVVHATATARSRVPLVASAKSKDANFNLDVTLVERPVDLVVGGVNVSPLVPSMLTLAVVITRLVESVPFTIVASPDYLKQNPAPDLPTELYGHVFVAIPPSMRKAGSSRAIHGDC